MKKLESVLDFLRKRLDSDKLFFYVRNRKKLACRKGCPASLSLKVSAVH